MVANEKENKHQYYAHQGEMQKRRKAEVEARMAKKRANSNNRAGSKDSASVNNKGQSTAYENNQQS